MNQHGVISRRQVISLGMSRAAIHRRTRSSKWDVMLPRVLRLAGAPRTWDQDVMAACLSVRGAASHRTAAALWRLDGFSPGVIEVVTTSQPRPPPKGVLLHRVRTLQQADVVTVRGIPTTTATRTLLDLGAVADATFVEKALDDALRRGLTSLPRLRWALQAGGKGRRGAPVLRSLLRERHPHDARMESPLEARLLRLIRRSRLPLPIAQFEVRRRGHVIARVDLAYPDAKLAIEADGYRYHSGKTAWHRDLERRNQLMGLGWRILHVTWDDLRRHPKRIIDEVEQALGQL